jgi:parallel beta-helix repeat protein
VQYKKRRGVNAIITNSVVKVGFAILASLLLAVLISVPAHGATYYVATSGSDSNPGTQAQPWRTIQKAADTLIAGDMVFVKEGPYNERVIPHNSGNPGDYIAYIAYPGDTVTIDGIGISTPGEFDWGGLFDVSGRTYIKISGFRIINSPSAGIFVGNSSHIIIEKNSTYNTFSSGIGVWDCSNIIIDNNEVELACNDGEEECITVALTDIFEVKNNHVHHGGPGTHGGEGIDAKDGSSNGKIYNNHVHDINKLGIYVDAWDKHTYNIDVFRNIVHDCTEEGFSVACEAGGLLENVRIYNNIAYNNGTVGITIADWGKAVVEHPMKNIKVINNTFYNNGMNNWGGGIFVENPNAENVVIRNNICSQNLSFQIAVEAGVPAENLAVDHNLIDGYREYPEEIYGSDYVEGNPMFANPSRADFHLQEDSPAIDNGSAVDAPSDDFDGNPRPQGAGYDIGAFEFMGTGVNESSNGK